MLCNGLPPRLYQSLKVLCCLANAGGPVQAHDASSVAELPPAQTAKILQLMTWAGFVESRRGTRGGFWLVRPPGRIRVTDVADFFVHHTKGGSSGRRDGLLKALESATARCRKEFSQITVADLAKMCGCRPRPSGEGRVPRERSRKLRLESKTTEKGGPQMTSGTRP